MKKITAFFMALLPIFVMVLLFAAGIIVKSSTHVYVQSVELADKSLVVQKPDEEHDKTLTLNARVLPMNATNPELYWKSSNENILTVDNQGNVACKTFGEAYVYAVSKENQTISSSCKIEVNDKDIHNIIVSDEQKYDVSYVGLNERKRINSTISPATGVIDPTIDYDLDDESKKYINVTSDGLILPIQQTPTGVKAKIKLHPHSGAYATKRIKEIEVQVGPGVEQLCVKDPTDTITSSSQYNVFDQLSTYPDKNVTAADFTYESDNEEAATIDTNGIAIFKKNEQVKFTATYKRNTSLTATKNVYSTCNSILDINFNCDSYTQNIEYKDNEYVPTVLDNSKFYCEVCPQATASTKYEIVSSDKSIVLPEKQSDGSYKFTALRPGCVMLYAYANEEGFEKIADGCYITVTSKDSGSSKDLGIIKTDSVTLDKGMFYYPLINSLNLPSDKRNPYAITYEFSTGGDIATIDANGILHFSQAGKAVITVKIDNVATGTITVISQDKTIDLESKDKLVVNVGQKYQFTDATAVFDEKSYKSNFDIDGNTWIAKNGCNIGEFELKIGGQTKTINLIVKEDPIYIKNTEPAFFSTEESTYNYKQKSTVSIVPSTATNSNGSNYSLNYSYDLSNDSIKVDGDNITFTDEGLVQVNTKIDNFDLSLKSWFKSTNGKLSKFIVKDANDNEVKSNQTITYDGSPLVYTVSNLTKTHAEQINYEIVSGQELCTIEPVKEETSTDVWKVTFTVKPIFSLYGQETIAITNQSYTVYLNIVIPATITDVDIMYGREVLSSSASITSYIRSLDLNIIPYPGLESVTKDGAYTAKLNGESLEIKNNKVTIDLTQGTKLEIFAKDSTTALKTYNFIYETDWTKFKISMIGVDENNNVYMSAKDTKKVLYLKANGLVPSNFFEDTSKFKVEFINATHSEISTIQQDILTISNIPNPDGNEYSLEFKLKYEDKELGDFKLTRDLVSKIVLPKHDNDDMTDKKGLQKVHVYGNKSFYTPEEKTIEGYKLPIEVYDYKGDQIVNTTEKPDIKAKAIKSLNLSISKNCSATYDEKNDCILIKFNKDTLYTEQEILNNSFDAKDGAKNVTFTASTKSNTANAKYTFVAVNGINVYNQEGIQTALGIDKQYGDGTIVLQTNFGVDNLEKDNAKFEIMPSYIGGIYGNGYTFSTSYQIEHDPNNYDFSGQFIFNTVLEGSSDDYYKKMQSSSKHQYLLHSMNYYNNPYFRYIVYKNFSNGIQYDLHNFIVPIKDSLFYNNKVSALQTNHSNGDALIENCVFFDCGGLPIVIKEGGLHFKGYVGIYNFHNKEALKDVFGTDLSSLWPLVEKSAKAANMTEIGADGRLYVNSFMAAALTDNFYFWNNKTQDFKKGEKGSPDAANFIAKYFDFKIPFTSINANLWATYNRTVDPASFSYYDEYDQDGKIRLDFLSNQINKLLRKPTYF